MKNKQRQKLHKFNTLLQEDTNTLLVARYNASTGQSLTHEELPNTLLSLLVAQENLKSLLLVKVNPDEHGDIDPDELKDRVFPDGVYRKLIFSSGTNFYFADEDLYNAIEKFYDTEPDAAIRYGALLTSNCYKGLGRIPNLRVKIVDFSDPQYADLRTGDCHGKVSSAIALELGGKENCPLQFRAAWDSSWNRPLIPTLPEPSFLAKGTLLPDDNLCNKFNCDILLDRSSIKGISKEQLSQLIQCDVHTFPQLAIGNRGNAEITLYHCSWQFIAWFSENAIRLDLGPETQRQAQKLSELQHDTWKLAQFLIQDHDLRQQLRRERNGGDTSLDMDVDDDFDPDFDDDPTESAEDVHRMIEILRSDRYGLLLEHPQVASFMRNQLASKWRDLAIKSGVLFNAAMALPGARDIEGVDLPRLADELERGTVCIPGIPDGEEVVITRYPIISSDNIRKYKNVHHPEMMKYHGVVWIHPKDAALFHQADFDGDFLMYKRAKEIPHIAAETLPADATQWKFGEVPKRPKVAYTKVMNANGKPKYPTLAHIAAVAHQNKIGLVATLIGRVASALPDADALSHPDKLKEFATQQFKLLKNRLFPALQVEVDSPKSEERLENLCDRKGNNWGSQLIKAAKTWCAIYPSHFFDFKKDQKLYQNYPMPTTQANSVSVLAREFVNPLWEKTLIRQLPTWQFRDIMPSSEEFWTKGYTDYAQTLSDRSRTGMRELRQRCGKDGNAFKEGLQQLYRDFRAELHLRYPDPAARQEIAKILWYIQTKKPRQEHEVNSLACARKMPVTLEYESEFKAPNQALPYEAWVLSVPFDRAEAFKTELDHADIAHTAIIRNDVPAVDFALQDLDPEILSQLQDLYQRNKIDYLELPIPEWVVPNDKLLKWAHYEDKATKGSLMFTVFTDELCATLETIEVTHTAITGIRHHEYDGCRFKAEDGWTEPLEFRVISQHQPNTKYHHAPTAALIADTGNPDKPYYTLGTYADNVPQLPAGATFEASITPQIPKDREKQKKPPSTVNLHIVPGSISLPQYPNLVMRPKAEITPIKVQTPQIQAPASPTTELTLIQRILKTLDDPPPQTPQHPPQVQTPANPQPSGLTMMQRILATLDEPPTPPVAQPRQMNSDVLQQMIAAAEKVSPSSIQPTAQPQKEDEWEL